jgi:hypothetical protein
VPLTDEQVIYTESEVPLDEISLTATEVVLSQGGRISRESRERIDFRLPRRAGVGAAGEIECSVSWAPTAAGEGDVTLRAGEEIMAPRPQRLALLVVGSLGALLWIIWPFFPHMGALAWTGGALAIAVYLMTLRRSPQGMMWMMLQQIAEIQRARQEELQQPPEM